MLPQIIDAYRTCEFATLGKDGTPIAWPTSGIRTADGDFLLTTSLGYPQKAFNVRRDERVALLFSDPTASALDRPSQILVRGTATCAAQIHTEPTGDLGRFWSMILSRQPGSQRYLDWPVNRFIDFYFMRLLIKVTPTEVTVNELPEPAAPQDNGIIGSSVLSAYPTAVLAACDASGAPTLMRTTVTSTANGYQVAAPARFPDMTGPGSLLVHRHDDRLDNIHNAVVVGSLDDEGLLRPSRLIEPAGRLGGGPADLLRTMRNLRGTTNRYLDRRGLTRPAIPWPAYRMIRAAARSGRSTP
ncbi:pyridoxamine 5'-phosphate oxidase family protein [Paractinoplanes hotanensis]|uniref:Pyridoxamine 5'-phosphate oxidase family protein n=1 Tax=Paractinoplanes hotanensis TaxID=2906497 RepID=A0ABT0Y518_9ACTN|nr:pyridoxamine 5'-phosphate oxidase family protein [Actinoplanes hotanensis]MCM4081130.1 pyridoxamine 5'-phosphate oxidase family protein [Actinoplanes hotanensis]